MKIEEKVDHVMSTVEQDTASGVCALHDDCNLVIIHPAGPTNMDSVCEECLREALHCWFTDIERLEAEELPYGADKWEEVQSSNIANIGLKGDDLFIKFKRGKTYRYPGAGKHYPMLMGARSKGKAFARLKSALTEYEKL